MTPSFETYQRIHQAMQLIQLGAIDDLDCGRHDLTNGLYVDVMEYETKEKGVFESHHKYIDIHYLIMGTELIEIADEEKLIVTNEYDEDGDYVLGNAEGQKYELKEKTPSVVMSGEAHLPGLSLGEIAKVKKAVVKVPL